MIVVNIALLIVYTIKFINLYIQRHTLIVFIIVDTINNYNIYTITNNQAIMCVFINIKKCLIILTSI